MFNNDRQDKRYTLLYNAKHRGGPVEKSDKQIGFRVSEELKRRIEVQAEKEKRSVSNLIIKVMIEYLEQHEDQG